MTTKTTTENKKAKKFQEKKAKAFLSFNLRTTQDVNVTIYLCTNTHMICESNTLKKEEGSLEKKNENPTNTMG